MKRDSNKHLGQWGEALCARYLYRQGYTVLLHHYAVRGGEIDLLAEKGETLAVVEVRLRSGRDLSGAETITRHKRQCLRRAMDTYIQSHPEAMERCIRFDVCQITAPDGVHTQSPELEYYENAFYCP